jgi:hypothetical protein
VQPPLRDLVKLISGITRLVEDRVRIFGRVASGRHECEELMKTDQTFSSSAGKIPFPKIFMPRELATIAMLSVTGWSISIIVLICLATDGPSYSGAEFVSLTAFP